jgi:hypothetical protein
MDIEPQEERAVEERQGIAAPLHTSPLAAALGGVAVSFILVIAVAALSLAYVAFA